MLGFDWPLIFLLLPLPLAAILFLPAKKRAVLAALRVPFFTQLTDGMPPAKPPALKRALDMFLLLCLWCLLIIAAARPTWHGDPVLLPNVGRDLMLAVDVSQSMEVTDLSINRQKVNRLEAVKHVLNDFISRRTNDRLGLILFGTEAFLQAPLTFDRQTVRTFLNEAQLAIAGPRTAIGDAIGLAVKRLKERPSDSRLLILLTDGANTAGKVDPIQAAELAKKINLKIYTIGVGASEMVVKSFFGSKRVNPSDDLDEETLKAIAESTNGLYFRAENIDELKEIYQRLDELEPIESDHKTVRPLKSLIHWPLSVALFTGMLLFVRHRLR